MSNERPVAELPQQQHGFGVELVLAILPAVAFLYANAAGSLSMLTDLHIGAGTVWTAVVVCYGFGLAPVLDGRDAAGSLGLLARVVPVTVFLFPALTLVTIGSGLELAVTHELLSNPGPVLWTVLALAGAIVILAFGVVLRNDVRLYRGLTADDPDTERLAALGTRNARFLTAQGTLQLMMLFLMYQLSGQLG